MLPQTRSPYILDERVSSLNHPNEERKAETSTHPQALYTPSIQNNKTFDLITKTYEAK